MRTPLNTHLFSVLRDAAEGLPELGERFMFGSDALFANGAIFALVWDGRIAVKLPVAAHFQALSALGAEPWSPMKGRPMGHWLLVPEELHDDPDALRVWVERAHRSAIEAGFGKAAKKRKATARATQQGTERSGGRDRKRAPPRGAPPKSPSRTRAAKRRVR